MDRGDIDFCYPRLVNGYLLPTSLLPNVALSTEVYEAVSGTQFVFRSPSPLPGPRPGHAGHVRQLRRAIPAAAGPGDVAEAGLQGLRGTDPAEIEPPASEPAVEGLKFAECLPPDLATRAVRARLADVRGVTGALDRRTRVVVAN
jgi:hypothetical protein